MAKIEAPAGCASCGQALTEDIVWCTSCGVAQHRDCFTRAGRCGADRCRGMRFGEQPGRRRGARWVERREGSAPAVPQAYIVDFTSFREMLGIPAVVFGALMTYHWLGIGALPSWPPGAIAGLALALFGGALLAGANDYRIVDSKTRSVWLHAQFFNWVKLTELVRFDACEELVLGHQTYGYRVWKRHWQLWLVRKDGGALELSRVIEMLPARDQPLRVPAEMELTATRLATITGLPRRTEVDWKPSTGPGVGARRI